MKKYFISLILILNITYSSAGQERGNGGDGILCNQEIQILDFYEYNFYNSYLKNSHLEGKSYQDILNNIFMYLKENDIIRYRIFQKLYNNMNLNMVFRNSIPAIDDSLHFPFHYLCQIKQIARFTINNRRLVHYEIDREIFFSLNEINKSGLILHEIIYSHFKELGFNNSVKARQYLRFIFKSYLFPKIHDYISYIQLNSLFLYYEKDSRIYLTQRIKRRGNKIRN